MKCFINCSIGLVFLIANFYCMFSVDKSKRKDKFFKTLNLELQNKYTKIIEERRKIYYQGFILGILLSFLMVLISSTFKKNLSNQQVVCTVLTVTLVTNYLYYILAPKSDWIILYLDSMKEREGWLDIYRSMQVKYHTGLVLGLIAVMAFANGSCYMRKQLKKRN
jgi:hypothetical protein